MPTSRGADAPDPSGAAANRLIERLDRNDTRTEVRHARARALTRRTKMYTNARCPSLVFVNHVTTNPYMSRARDGAQNAYTLLGAACQRTGSETSNVREMLTTFDAALPGWTDGIAIALTDPKVVNAPVTAAQLATVDAYAGGHP